MAVYAGIDLHSTNVYLGIIDDEDRRLYKKRLPNDLEEMKRALGTHREDIKGVAVESTYNWYWLVDGLMADGYEVHLAHPAGLSPYTGTKFADDEDDARWLAHLLRLGILPEGFIYPKEDRPVRDLLRRRGMLVRQRTSHILSFQGLCARQLAGCPRVPVIEKLDPESLIDVFGDEHLALAGQSNLLTIKFLSTRIAAFEKAVLSKTRLKPEYVNLLTVPGIGKILALTIALETGDIARFPTDGDYSSYCRAVRSERITNGKKKGKGNVKNGNKHLGWAYVEAANYCKRSCASAKRFHQKKEAKTKNVVATKALANKLTKAGFYIMRDGVKFDEKKLFG